MMSGLAVVVQVGDGGAFGTKAGVELDPLPVGIVAGHGERTAAEQKRGNETVN